MELGTFRSYKNQKSRGGDEYIDAKKSADAIGKELVEKQRHIQTVLRDPRYELPIRQDQAEKTQDEIDCFWLHRSLLGAQGVDRMHAPGVAADGT